MARATQNSVLVQMMEVMMRRMELACVVALRALPDVAVLTQTLVKSLHAIESGDPMQIDQATAERIEILETAWQRATGKLLHHRPLSPAGMLQSQPTPSKPKTTQVPARARSKKFLVRS